MPPLRRPARKALEERSAGGVVFRRADGKPVYLLIRDSYHNWGFPKGHIEKGEDPRGAALREVREETGLTDLAVHGEIEVIDWFFRFRGRLIHKTCHFYLLETAESQTTPQLDEGITACRWSTFRRAERLIAYPNARAVLRRARAMVDPAGPRAARKPA